MLVFIYGRLKEKLIKMPNIKPVDEKSTERYFHNMLLAFKPWRIEAIEIKDQHLTYQDAFDHEFLNNNLSERFVEFSLQRNKIDRAKHLSNDLLQEIEIESANHVDYEHSSDAEADISIELNNSKPQLLNLGVTDYSESHLNPSKILEYETSINVEQMQIYNEIIDHINHQEQHKLGFCKCGQKASDDLLVVLLVSFISLVFTQKKISSFQINSLILYMNTKNSCYNKNNNLYV